ncbi:MAG: aminotransferase class I/II-fold pyridoxal phosphate-dependent enzyme [candidate division Zixibacteria bacterium]
MGTITGTAAMALISFDRKAIADIVPGRSLLADYEGRLCYNENPLGPSPAAKIALHNEVDLCHRYPDWFADSLVTKLADNYQLSNSQVICGAGATEILRLCATAFAEPGGNIVAPYPSYSQFPNDSELFGSSVRYSDLDSYYRVDLQDMMSRVDNNTTAVCLTNPNNPTGTIVNAVNLSNFIDDLPSGVVTIVDEAYYEYINESNYQSAIELVHQGKNVVVVKTFSKVHGLAGARIGFVLGRESRINEIKANRIFATVSRPALEAAKASLPSDHHLNNHIYRTKALAIETKNFCFREFDRIGLNYIPSEASFFMVDVGNGDYVRSQLASHGILVRTGWGMNDHIRVSTGTMEEMEYFIEVLRSILELRRLPKAGTPPLPSVTELFQAYPNPFNSSTSIRITLPQEQSTRLEVFDIRGRLVRLLVDRVLGAGEHTFIWDASNNTGSAVSSGSYFYRLTSDNDVMVRRVILLK